MLFCPFQFQLLFYRRYYTKQRKNQATEKSAAFELGQRNLGTGPRGFIQNAGYLFLRLLRAANIACLVARRFLVLRERDALFLISCDALFAIKYIEKNYE